MPDALVLDRVGVRYGGVIALHDVSLEVVPGKTLGLIGPNGAGKTTLINATTGIATLATGTIALGARRLDGLPPHRIARAGIARTYQNIRLFGALDVRTNLAAGAYAQPGRLTDAAARELKIDRIELRAMLVLAAPLVLAELGWMAMGIEDTMFVGRIGDRAALRAALHRQ